MKRKLFKKLKKFSDRSPQRVEMNKVELLFTIPKNLCRKCLKVHSNQCSFICLQYLTKRILERIFTETPLTNDWTISILDDAIIRYLDRLLDRYRETKNIVLLNTMRVILNTYNRHKNNVGLDCCVCHLDRKLCKLQRVRITEAIERELSISLNGILTHWGISLIKDFQLVHQTEESKAAFKNLLKIINKRKSILLEEN